MPEWKIILEPGIPPRLAAPGECNSYADASLTCFDLSNLPAEYQNEAFLSWLAQQQPDAGNGGGGGGGVMDWGTLVNNAETEAGKLAIKAAGNAIRTGNNPSTDHIPAQNQTVANFKSILDAYNAGQLSAADARAQVTRWDQAFLLLTQQIGSSRALKGGAEVHALAQNIISTLGGPSGGDPVTPPGGGGINVNPLISQNMLIFGGLALAAIFILPKLGKKS